MVKTMSLTNSMLLYGIFRHKWQVFSLLITSFFINRQMREDMVLADMHLKPGEPWEYCPREALRRVSKILKEEFDLVSF